jgi:hypothetical protein
VGDQARRARSGLDWSLPAEIGEGAACGALRVPADQPPQSNLSQWNAWIRSGDALTQNNRTRDMATFESYSAIKVVTNLERFGIDFEIGPEQTGIRIQFDAHGVISKKRLRQRVLAFIGAFLRAEQGRQQEPFSTSRLSIQPFSLEIDADVGCKCFLEWYQLFNIDADGADSVCLARHRRNASR